MLLTFRRTVAAIVLVLLNLITVPQPAHALAVHLAPREIYPARADHVPVRLYTRFLLHNSAKEFACVAKIFSRESHWNPKAFNHTTVWLGGKPLHAAGIPQILGLSIHVDAYGQVRQGIRYIERRYGTACNAWAWWQVHYSY